jgi:hypothetical protein
MYSKVTIYLPDHSTRVTCLHQAKLLQVDRQPVEKKLSRINYEVLPVDEQPPQLLQLADCSDSAMEIEDVEMRDGMKLSVVVNERVSMLLEQQVSFAENPTDQSPSPLKGILGRIACPLWAAVGCYICMCFQVPSREKGTDDNAEATDVPKRCIGCIGGEMK